jgi:hypothetical protein
MANYINTETMAYPVSQQQIQEAFPNTSFPIPFVAPPPYMPVFDSPQPSYDPYTQYVQQTTPELTDGQWYQAWVVLELTPEQQAAYVAQVQQQTTATAQQLLSATDWTAIASVADPAVSNPYLTNQAEFLSYRSTVRNLGVNPPTTAPTFPTVPEQKWSN